MQQRPMQRHCPASCDSSARMQGNCTEDLPAALAAAAAVPPLLPLQPGQCVIASPVNVVAVRGQLWMDNVYLRAVAVAEVEEEAPADPPAGSAEVTGAARTRRDGRTVPETIDGAAAAGSRGAVELVTVSGVPGGAELWMTRCTVQGAVDASGGGGVAAAVAGLQVTGQASADGAGLLGSLCTAAWFCTHSCEYLHIWDRAM